MNVVSSGKRHPLALKLRKPPIGDGPKRPGVTRSSCLMEEQTDVHNTAPDRVVDPGAGRANSGRAGQDRAAARVGAAGTGRGAEAGRAPAHEGGRTGKGVS